MSRYRWEDSIKRGNINIVKQGAEENIWTYEGGSNRRKLHNGELHNLYCSINIILEWSNQEGLDGQGI
jgi:hypothetical protein